MTTKDEKFKELLAKANASAETKPAKVVPPVEHILFRPRFLDEMEPGSGGGSGGMRGFANNS